MWTMQSGPKLYYVYVDFKSQKMNDFGLLRAIVMGLAPFDAALQQTQSKLKKAADNKCYT